MGNGALGDFSPGPQVNTVDSGSGWVSVSSTGTNSSDAYCAANQAGTDYLNNNPSASSVDTTVQYTDANGVQWTENGAVTRQGMKDGCKTCKGYKATMKKNPPQVMQNSMSLLRANGI